MSPILGTEETKVKPTSFGRLSTILPAVLLPIKKFSPTLLQNVTNILNGEIDIGDSANL
jgi:hypothetical protein